MRSLFDDELEALRVSTRRFVDTELRPHVDDWEREGHFPDDVFRRCGELGFLGFHYPERWGGSGGAIGAGIVLMEELARCGTAAIAMAVGVQADMATRARRVRHRRPAGALPAPRHRRRVAAIAITEPDAGSDVAGITTRAVRDGDAWHIRGNKLYITNGARADFLTLVAKTDPEAGHRGFSLFLVDTDLSGVHVSRTLDKLGIR